MEGWVDLDGWVVGTSLTCQQRVTHPSSSRAQCRLTTMIEANALTTTPIRHMVSSSPAAEYIQQTQLNLSRERPPTFSTGTQRSSTSATPTLWVKKSPWGFLTFLPNGWDLRAYYTFLSMLDYLQLSILISNYQLSATLTKLWHIKRDHPVHIICSNCPPSAETHVGWYNV